MAANADDGGRIQRRIARMQRGEIAGRTVAGDADAVDHAGGDLGEPVHGVAAAGGAEDGLGHGGAELGDRDERAELRAEAAGCGHHRGVQGEAADPHGQVDRRGAGQVERVGSGGEERGPGIREYRSLEKGDHGEPVCLRGCHGLRLAEALSPAHCVSVCRPPPGPIRAEGPGGRATFLYATRESRWSSLSRPGETLCRTRAAPGGRHTRTSRGLDKLDQRSGRDTRARHGVSTGSTNGTGTR